MCVLQFIHLPRACARACCILPRCVLFPLVHTPSARTGACMLCFATSHVCSRAYTFARALCVQCHWACGRINSSSKTKRRTHACVGVLGAVSVHTARAVIRVASSPLSNGHALRCVCGLVGSAFVAQPWVLTHALFPRRPANARPLCSEMECHARRAGQMER